MCLSVFISRVLAFGRYGSDYKKRVEACFKLEEYAKIVAKLIVDGCEPISKDVEIQFRYRTNISPFIPLAIVSLKRVRNFISYLSEKEFVNDHSF